jgi:hypothetical protein
MRFDTHIPVKLHDAYQARHEPEAQQLFARLYWAFLIVFLVIGIIASLGWGAREFLQEPQTDAGLDIRPQPIFSRAELVTVIQGFEARSERFEARVKAPITIKDPSAK